MNRCVTLYSVTWWTPNFAQELAKAQFIQKQVTEIHEHSGISLQSISTMQPNPYSPPESQPSPTSIETTGSLFILIWLIVATLFYLAFVLLLLSSAPDRTAAWIYGAILPVLLLWLRDVSRHRMSITYGWITITSHLLILAGIMQTSNVNIFNVLTAHGCMLFAFGIPIIIAWLQSKRAKP